MAKLNYSSGLPKSISNKIYKTGQTRGSEKDEIFQNRVLRSSNVLIPYYSWKNGSIIPNQGFENNYIVLIDPETYFTIKDELDDRLILGHNLLVFYETRSDWNTYNPSNYGWHYATSRISPLNGQYIARIPDTTRSGDSVIRHGFTSASTGGQGAGIRVFEYASKETITNCYYQLAYLAWHTEGIDDLCIKEGIYDTTPYKKHVEEYCKKNGLIDKIKLEENRLIINNKTVCPLCLEPIKAIELSSRAEQAEGRESQYLTITKANLFHNNELKIGEYNHMTYNLGWGHHHCNTVVRDIGIKNTLDWMYLVLKNNDYIK